MQPQILVPLDGSALAEGVLPHAVALARLSASALVLLQVIPSRSGLPSVASRASERRDIQLDGAVHATSTQRPAGRRCRHDSPGTCGRMRVSPKPSNTRSRMMTPGTLRAVDTRARSEVNKSSPPVCSTIATNTLTPQTMIGPLCQDHEPAIIRSTGTATTPFYSNPI